VLVWARSALASALLAAGDVAAALRHANAAAEVDAPPGFHIAGQPGWALGNALIAAGNADRAVSTLLDAFGGPDLPSILPAQRPAAAADLAEAQLACGDADGAEVTLLRGRELAARSGVAWSAAVIDLGWAALLHGRGRPKEALDAAAAVCEITSGAPLLGARARVARGKALGAAGERRSAIETLVGAEAELDGYGALRRRDEAVRELRALGHRVLRPARHSPAAAVGPLTSREAEIAELVAAGRTNREIGEQLVLSLSGVQTLTFVVEKFCSKALIALL
jgi:DNA-binding NarL/FixJ family response regulator